MTISSLDNYLNQPIYVESTEQTQDGHVTIHAWTLDEIVEDNLIVGYRKERQVQFVTTDGDFLELSGLCEFAKFDNGLVNFIKPISEERFSSVPLSVPLLMNQSQ